MVRTTHPGNIGSAARAMGNMGLRRLALVEPLCDHNSPEAVARSSGYGEILEDAQVHPTLADAIAGAKHAFAFTARRRDLSQPVADVRAAAARMAEEIASGMKVALVFGPEQAGLTNTDTDVCDLIVEIPTEPGHSSLNVAASIQVACHELRMAALGPGVAAERPVPVDKRDVQALVEHITKVIDETSPSKSPGMLNKMVRRLTMLLNRSCPDEADVRLLRGLLSSVSKGDAAKKRKGK